MERKTLTGLHTCDHVNLTAPLWAPSSGSVWESKTLTWEHIWDHEIEALGTGVGALGGAFEGTYGYASFDTLERAVGLVVGDYEGFEVHGQLYSCVAFW